MDRILEILGAALDTFTPEALAEHLLTLDADLLSELDGLLVAEAERLLSEPTPASVAEAEPIMAAVTSVRADTTRRATEQQSAAEAAEAHLAALRGEVASEPEPAPPAEDPAAESEAVTPPAEDPAAESEAVTPPAEPAAVEPIAAAAIKPSQLTPPAKPKAKTVTRPRTALIAAAGVPGFAAGGAIKDRAELAKATANRLDAIKGGGSAIVASARTEYPTERRLSGEARRDAELVEASTVARQALVASGGVCMPVAVDYRQFVIAEANRPVRDDALDQFDASRGGITRTPTPTLGDLAGALTVWTYANDVTPASPSTKNVLTVPCEEPVTTRVDAIVARLRFGNYVDRFNPEVVAANNDLALAAHARLAEQTLLSRMDTLSTAVNYTGTVGAARELFAQVAVAIAGMRSRERSGAPIRVVMPDWVLPEQQADYALALPGDNSVGLTREEIGAKFNALGARITYTPDRDVFGAQGVDNLHFFPDVVKWNIYFEGSFLFLDGGTLDLGVVRDISSNSTNNYETFMETFENVAHVGPQALIVSSTVCANGATAGTLTPDDCSGS